MRKPASLLFMFFAIIVWNFLSIRCGGSKSAVSDDVDIGLYEEQDESADELDRLLGLAPAYSDDDEKATDESGNDDVLNVLDDSSEIIDDINQTKQKQTGIEEKDQTVEIKSAESSGQIKELTNQVAELETDLQKARNEISNLKSKISVKDRTIIQTQDELERYKKYGQQSGETTKVQQYPKTKIAPAQFEQQYNNAYNSFLSKDYEGSQTVFQNLLASDPTNNLSDNCQYWIGECFYAMRRFEEAIIAFEKVFTFAKSNKEDDAQLKLGICYLRLGDKKKAKEEFLRLTNEYPDSEYVQKAESYLANL